MDMAADCTVMTKGRLLDSSIPRRRARSVGVVELRWEDGQPMELRRIRPGGLLVHVGSILMVSTLP